MLEREVEGRLVRKVRELGGLCLKFVSPGCQGVPDRVVLIAGRVIFVETKSPTGRTRPLQEHRIAEMKKRGADVRILKTPAAVDEFIKEVAAI